MPPTARHIARGNVASPVPAHQDVSYNRRTSDFFTMWTPFVPIDETCGGVGIYRGTNAAHEIGAAQNGFRLGGVAADERTIVHPHLAPGDVLFLNTSYRAELENALEIFDQDRFIDEDEIKEWPGETQAVDEFLASPPGVRIQTLPWTNRPAGFLVKP